MQRTGVEKDSADNAAFMSVGQLAAVTKVSSRTIRYYEELDILPPPPRSPRGTRKYPPEYRFYVEGALALKELGFSLDEIRLLGRLALGRPMSESDRGVTKEVLRAKTSTLERRIKVLQRLRDLVRDQEHREGGRVAFDLADLSELIESIAPDEPSS